MKGFYRKHGDGFRVGVAKCVAETFNDLMEINEVNEYDVEEGTGIEFEYLERLAKGLCFSIGIWELYQISEYFNVSIDELLRRG